MCEITPLPTFPVTMQRIQYYIISVRKIRVCVRIANDSSPGDFGQGWFRLKSWSAENTTDSGLWQPSFENQYKKPYMQRTRASCHRRRVCLSRRRSAIIVQRENCPITVMAGDTVYEYAGYQQDWNGLNY